MVYTVSGLCYTVLYSLYKGQLVIQCYTIQPVSRQNRHYTALYSLYKALNIIRFIRINHLGLRPRYFLLLSRIICTGPRADLLYYVLYVLYYIIY